VYAMIASCDGGPIKPQHLPPRLLAAGPIEPQHLLSAGPASHSPQRPNAMVPTVAVLGDPAAASTTPGAPNSRPASYAARRRAFERQELHSAYQQAAGNVAQMARDLQMDRSTLHHKLIAHAIHLPRQERFRAQELRMAATENLAAAADVSADTANNSVPTGLQK
jgi:transcriptional regulator of acetoin/glycerol metabolism